MVLSAFDDYFLDILFHLELQNGGFLILSFLIYLLTGISYKEGCSTINYLATQEWQEKTLILFQFSE